MSKKLTLAEKVWRDHVVAPGETAPLLDLY